MAILPIQLPHSTSPSEELSALLKDLREWLLEITRTHKGQPWSGIHDAGTFLTSFREYYRLTQDPLVKELVLDRFDAATRWANVNFVEGYWPRQEVHHGIEHFVIFLRWLLELDPGNPVLQSQIRTAANHIINKGMKPQEWFNFEANRFASVYLGTQEVGSDGINVPEHLRFVYLARRGLTTGGPDRLREFAHQYSLEWARGVAQEPVIPVYLGEKNLENTKMFKKLYVRIVGAAPRSLTTPERAEIHIANGVPDLFMDLYEETKQGVYLDATERLLRESLRQLESPYAHPLGPLLGRIYALGRIPELPTLLSGIMAEPRDLWDKTLSLTLNPHWQKRKQYGILFPVGMRRKMPVPQIHDHQRREDLSIPSPGTLALGYKITKKKDNLLTALIIARAVFREARMHLPDGSQHGCGSQTISAMCVGHGRNWGAGYVSSVLDFIPKNLQL